MLASNAKPAYITLIENSDAGVSVNAFLKKLDACVDNMLSRKLGMGSAGGYHHACEADLATIISEIDIDNQIDLPVRNILLNAVINAEKLAAGSGIIAVIAFLELRKRPESQTDPNALVGHTHVTDLKTTKDILKRIFGVDNKLYHMILKACDIAGHNGSIYINNIPKDTSYIELTSGYRFSCHMDKSFEAAAKITKWNRSHVRAFIIDGIIETVGEINHILEYMSESKEAGIIFARGYSEEVIATLAVNAKRKTLDIVPVIVPFDLQGMNMLKDIAVVCGSDVVSSLKGELISSIEIDTIPVIDFVLADMAHIIIEHPPTQRSARVHLKNLKTRIEKENSEDKIKLLNDRVKALASNCVEVSFGTEYSKNIQLAVSRFEAGIRMTAEIARSGIIELQGKKLDQQHVASHVFQKLIDSNYSYVSAMAMLHGIQAGCNAKQFIDTIGAFILQDH